MKISLRDMQAQSIDDNITVFKCLNKLMDDNGVPNPNLKGFLQDSVEANFNVVRIVYGVGDPKVAIVECERTCLFFWATSMYKHKETFVAKKFQNKHV